MDKRTINLKIGYFMGWDKYDTNPQEFYSIVGKIYFIPDIGDYNPCDNFYQLKKVMDKMNSLDYRFQIHQKEGDNLWCAILWPGETHDDEIMAEAAYSNEFGVAICLCILRTMKEDVPKLLII